VTGWDADSVFEVLGSELARKILVLTSAEPLSADELTERCNASQPTVYRRLDALEEYDMVREEVQYDEDGNHYAAYECRLEEVCFSVTDGAFSVDLELERTVVDDELDDLGESTPASDAESGR
jgi:DNA-binding transcriptional ArsR family regulator